MPVRQLKDVLKKSVERKFHSVDEAEILTGISRWTWRDWIAAGKIDSFKLGTLVKIPQEEIDRILREGFRPRLPTAAKRSHKPKAEQQRASA
jgi:excisionase family DNA binding protein